MPEPVARAVGAYVPPRRFAAEMPPRRGAKVALTLNNLRLDADETDLKNLCSCFGPLRSVSISRDSKTGRSKGAGVVSFFKSADAQAALATLQGYAYGHLILEVGWAA
jgi:RNA recognition motif-containing protein